MDYMKRSTKTDADVVRAMHCSQRGFGAIELLIAVGLASVFLAVSIPMFLRSVHERQTGDARLELDRIGHTARQHFIDTGSYVVGTARQLPVQHRGGCCGATDGRETPAGSAAEWQRGSTDEHCAAEPAKFAADPVWRALEFNLYEPSAFYYDYTGTATTFVATAAGDLDCDGAETVLTLNGVTMASQPGAVPIITPGPRWLEPTAD